MTQGTGSVQSPEFSTAPSVQCPLCNNACAAHGAQKTARALQIHHHDISEGISQHTKNTTEGKGLLRFKSKILQDHYKSYLRWPKPRLALLRRWETGLLFSRKLCLPPSRGENKSQDLSHPIQKLTWKGHENICQTFFRAKDMERSRFPLHAAVLE